MIYALLDGSATVRAHHLIAAREVWRYCEESARYVLLGQARDWVSEKLLGALSDAGEDGLSGTQIRDLFGRHVRVDDLKRALTQLEAMGLVTKVAIKTRGRPETRWYATS